MNLRQAWTTAMLGKLDGEHFPKRPEYLWSKSGDKTQNILAIAKAMKASQDRENKPRRRGKPRRPRTIMRPE